MFVEKSQQNQRPVRKGGPNERIVFIQKCEIGAPFSETDNHRKPFTSLLVAVCVCQKKLKLYDGRAVRQRKTERKRKRETEREKREK